MSITLETLINIIQRIRELSPPKRWSFFSYFLLPIFIFLYWIPTTGISNLLSANNDQLIAYPLITTINNNGLIKSQDGILFLVDNFQSEFAIPTNNDSNKIWTSLSKDALDLNKNKFFIDNNYLKVSSNILGEMSPYAVIINGVRPNTVVLPREKKNIEDFYPTSVESKSVLLWIFIASIFGFGLLIPASEVNSLSV
ncbi:MAG: hypothetical protein IPM32_09105 [Ignavibacteriae bacterium]|nr:hypothetical protein [Ignavibacteriota bacterium]